MSWLHWSQSLLQLWGGLCFHPIEFDALFTLMISFAMRAHQFIDAYAKGLQGKGAAWAAKKYHGHHGLPEFILKEFEDAEKVGKAWFPPITVLTC